ncbi:hypothetical protein AWB75_05242 [Caballeronia catudaia]|uniref:Lipocalin-like domain-containing protein n=1 Tax=Caballeronia catudaia TaxID=1777136 RepID=A0A158CJC0_9BURK|nr:lipocalin-like domain-containing protein [Caballeronia catudaia]SAK82370.1 hypothetical protein AWB75_05242 [Caballeronia catudaia]
MYAVEQRRSGSELYVAFGHTLSRWSKGRMAGPDVCIRNQMKADGHRLTATSARRFTVAPAWLTGCYPKSLGHSNVSRETGPTVYLFRARCDFSIIHSPNFLGKISASFQTDRVRFYTIDGDTLTIKTEPNKSPVGGREGVGILTFERVKSRWPQ